MVKLPAADTICSKRAGSLNTQKVFEAIAVQRQSLFYLIVQKHWLFFEYSGFSKRQASQTLFIQTKGFPSISEIWKSIVIMFARGVPVYLGIRQSRPLGKENPVD